jgi:arylsulfatase A-like enzyme
MTDMTDQAIAWIKYQKVLTPDKPFFVYFAPGATHAPHHVPKEWIAAGRASSTRAGTSSARRPGAPDRAGRRAGRHEAAPQARGDQGLGHAQADEKRLFAARPRSSRRSRNTPTRGRPPAQGLRGVGQLDNTLVFYIAGDNGTSAEGGTNGMFNEYDLLQRRAGKVEDMLQKIDKWGGPETYPHMAAGWAVALDAPFGWMKQVPRTSAARATAWSCHWPKGIKARTRSARSSAT